MKSDVRHYRGNGASVTFDVPRCIHAEVCVRGLPQVFDASRRPWILPDEGDPKRLERVVLGCPTGALRMAPPTEEKIGKGAAAAATILPEEPRKKNSASITPDGPYYVRGNLEIEETPGAEVVKDTRVAFCRCGHSENKPLCDQSHERAGFRCEATVTPPLRTGAGGRRRGGSGPLHALSERPAGLPRPPHHLRPRGRARHSRPGKALPVRAFEEQAAVRRLAPGSGVQRAVGQPRERRCSHRHRPRRSAGLQAGAPSGRQTGGRRVPPRSGALPVR